MLSRPNSAHCQEIPFRRPTVRRRMPAAALFAMLASVSGLAQPRPQQVASAGAQIQADQLLPIRPIATTSQLMGTEDEVASVRLTALHRFDPLAQFQFTITSLPAAGELRQADGTPILTAPTVVSDPEGDIAYLGAPDSCSFDGVPVGSFTYTATYVRAQISSLPKSVSIILAPVYDAMPHLPPQQATEDSPQLIQLPASVEGQMYITETYDDFCAFYQVQADNVSIGAQINADASIQPVTNADRWIAVVPQPDVCGNLSAFFSYVDTLDHWPLLPPYQNDWRVEIDVACVNDAPIAIPGSLVCNNDELESPLDLLFYDPDGVSVFLTGFFTQVPQFGRLYRGAVAPENEVTLEINNTFNSFDRHFIFVRDPERLWQWGYADQLAFQVTDGELSSNEAVVTIDVVYRNLPPTIEPETTLTVNLDEDAQGRANIVADDDAGWQNVSIVPSALPQHGEMFYAEPQFGGGYVLHPITLGEPLPAPLGDPFTTWELAYVPDPDFNTAGTVPDEFRFIAYDGFGQRALDPAFPAWQDVPGEWTISLLVAPVNDAPVINGPGTITADWRFPAVVTSISVTDDADVAANLRVQVIGTDTSFSFVDLSGVDVISQTANAVMFEGTLAQINAAFQAGIEVPSPGLPHIDRHLLVSANDLGNSGSGGPLSAARAFVIAFE